MERHVRIIGLLYVFLGALWCCWVWACCSCSAEPPSPEPSNRDGSGVVVSLVGAVGGIVFLLLSLLSIPALVAGVGLLRHRPWARIVTILLSGFVLLVPISGGLANSPR